MLGVSADDKHCVTIDGKVVVGRRPHHRAGVHRPRLQGQSSPLWPQWAAAWPLVPRSRTLERPTPRRPSGSDGILFGDPPSLSTTILYFFGFCASGNVNDLCK